MNQNQSHTRSIPLMELAVVSKFCQGAKMFAPVVHSTGSEPSESKYFGQLQGKCIFNLFIHVMNLCF